MREILFRGKRLDNGKWVYGNLEKLNQDYFITSQQCVDDFLVDKDTVGQFTGLLDKNGKKIFEGDIVSFYEVLGQQGTMKPFKGVVKYGKCYYYVEYINERNRKGRWNLSSCWHLVVVGNIHDNGDLYKESKGEIK